MSSLKERAQKIVDEFAPLKDWEARYQKIIALGKQLPEFPESERTEINKVRGCQSQVWLIAEWNEGREMVLRGDSDALIVRGLVAVLLKVYSPADPEEILAFPPEFIRELGFEGNLSPSRTNGLHSMLRQIKNFAIAFRVLKSKK